MQINTHCGPIDELEDNSISLHQNEVLKTPEHNAFSALHQTVKKQSIQMTKNGKLIEIYQSPSADGKKTRENILREKRLKANTRIRKAALYGVGARSILPEVIEGSHEVKHDEHNHVIRNNSYSVVPPGAHADLFRYSRISGESDFIALNTTLSNDQIALRSQPAWYFGLNNKCNPPDHNVSSAVKRYGFRGTKNIEQHKVEPLQSPLATVTEHTPSFLSSIDHDYVNEYNAPILLAPYRTVNCQEAPRLWPKTAEYVNGSKLKLPLPSSSMRPNTSTSMRTSSHRSHSVMESESLTSQEIRRRQLRTASISSNHHQRHEHDYRSITAPETKHHHIIRALSPHPNPLPSSAPIISSPMIRGSSMESYDTSLGSSYDGGIDASGMYSSRNNIVNTVSSPTPMQPPSSSSSAQVMDMYPIDKPSSALSSASYHMKNDTITNEWEHMLKSAGAKMLSSSCQSRSSQQHHDSHKRTLDQQKYQKLKYDNNNIDDVIHHYHDDHHHNQAVMKDRGLASANDTLHSIGSISILRQGAITIKPETLQTQVNLSQKRSNTSYDMKWAQIELHMNSLRVHIDRHESMIHVIHHVCEALKEEAIINKPWTRAHNHHHNTSSLARHSSININTPSSSSLCYWQVDRMTFIGTLSKVSYLEGFHERQFSLMFSIYDVKRTNTLEYIDYISSLLVLADPQITIYDRLRIIYEYHLEYGNDNRSAIEIALKSCCSAVDDVYHLQQIEYEFKREFRCCCYSTAIIESPMHHHHSDGHHDKKSPRTGTSVAIIAATAAAMRAISSTQPILPSSMIGSTSDDRLGFGLSISSTASSSSHNLSRSSSIQKEGEHHHRHNPTPLDGTSSSTIKGNNSHPGTTSHPHQPTSSLSIDAFNVVDQYLNSSSFIHILQKCPRLLALVTASVDTRLTSYYGANYHCRHSAGYMSPSHLLALGPKHKFGAAVANMKLFRPPKKRDDDNDDGKDDNELKEKQDDGHDMIGNDANVSLENHDNNVIIQFESLSVE